MHGPLLKVQGFAQWDELIGRQIVFQWSDGYDPLQTIEGVLEEVKFQPGDDPRYPRIYLWFEDTGGYGIWAHETILVSLTPPVSQ